MKKEKFWNEYKGPRGPHLNQLTKMTLTGEREQDLGKQSSIHPGKKRVIHSGD